MRDGGEGDGGAAVPDNTRERAHPHTHTNTQVGEWVAGFYQAVDDAAAAHGVRKAETHARTNARTHERTHVSTHAPTHAPIAKQAPAWLLARTRGQGHAIATRMPTRSRAFHANGMVNT